MGLYEEFARRYLLEALRDLVRAERALRESDYPETVFHSQQAVEKAVKALVEAKRRYVYNHGPELASVLLEAYTAAELPELDEIVDILEWFTEYYTRSRYPFLFRSRVYSPDEFIDRDLAVEALERARRVVEVAKRVLQEKGITV